MVIPASSPGASTLALGFGTTVAMWAVGYFCRLPRSSGMHAVALVPNWVLLTGFLVCLLTGGYVAGRYSGRSGRAGLYVGLVCGLLNLMILGSLLTGDEPNRILRSAVWWVPASIAFCGVVATIGAMIGAARPYRGGEINWTGAFAKVAVAAMLLLLMAGGLVTSKEAGLAVVDWPNSEGSLMFLYPLSKMTGGSYYEHSHRLFGSLVGLTTLVLAVHLWRNDPRVQVRSLVLLALVAVIVQGVLGGLRVTGYFTLSTDPHAVSPKTYLAVVHGVFGQVVFGLLTAIAVVTSTTWYSSVVAETSPRRQMDRALTAVLVGLLVAQLTLGALVRHLVTPPMQMFHLASRLLLVHISLATIVVVWGALAGARAWGFYGERFRILRRFGLGLIWLAIAQVLLGFASLVVTGSRFDLKAWPSPTTTEVIITTLHQTAGAVMLAWAVGLSLWVRHEPMADWHAKGFSPTD